MSSSKTITICSTSFHEYDRRLKRITASLSEAGYSVQWISRSKNSAENTSTYTAHIIIRTVFKSGILFYLEFNLRLFISLLSCSTDAIVAIDLDTIPACTLANLFRRKKILHDAHEIYYEVPELTGRPIKKSIWKFIAKIFLPHIKENYTVNLSLKNHYEKKYKTSYEVIRNVPQPFSISELYQNNKTLVYLGVLNDGRGVELAIEAMETLKDYTLILIGEGDNYSSLREQASSLENVIFKGYTLPHEIPGILKECSIGLNILRADSLNYKLSLANKFFDYMHAHIPSINMNYPEYEHILNAHRVGLMVEDYSTEKLISAIRTLEDPQLYRRLTENCLAYKNEYTWDAESQKLINLYHSVFNS